MFALVLAARRAPACPREVGSGRGRALLAGAGADRAAALLLSREEPGRYAERRGWSLDRRPWLIETAAQRVNGEQSGFDGSVEERPFLARPDAYWVTTRPASTRSSPAQARGGRRTARLRHGRRIPAVGDRGRPGQRLCGLQLAR